MRRIRRDNLIKRTAAVLGNNEGASLVLVSILAILVVTAVVILRVTSSTYMASANRQANQDQAYELAASLGESIDELIENGKYDISVVPDGKQILKVGHGTSHHLSGLPAKSYAVAEVSNITGGKRLKVTAVVGNAEYIYTKEYRS